MVTSRRWLVLGLVCFLVAKCTPPTTFAQAVSKDDPSVSKDGRNASGAESPPLILMIAGRPSHGFGAHEHYAGLKLLEESIARNKPPVRVKVVKGWPEDADLVDRAKSIVIFCDGGKRHVAMPHRDRIRQKLKTGGGLVAIHYATEMLPGESGDDWVELLGGHFEVHRSVNPHWIADFTQLPKHPVANGVKPFKTDDEWYFNLRFSDSGKLTPILQAVAPEQTMRRKDGPHSGNPDVRKKVQRGDLHTVAWAYEPEFGGRAFGITGGHHHWNWSNPNMNRVVTNGVLWTAGVEIAPSGSTLPTIGMDDLLENQDYPKPEKVNLDAIRAKFEIAAED
ncbi:MAG: ThuA domain-containing protein [Planctomycetota bacterium]